MNKNLDTIDQTEDEQWSRRNLLDLIWARSPRRQSSVIAAPAFTPIDIVGLKLWLKANSLGLTDGTLVSSWPDSSGNVDNATATGTERPTYRSTGLGSLPSVESNASSKMDLAVPFSLASGFTIYAVGMRASGQGWFPVSSNTNVSFSGIFTDDIFYARDNATNAGTLTVGNTPGIFMARWHRPDAATAIKFMTNAFAEASVTVPIGTLVIANLFYAFGGSVNSVGQFAEILVYDPELSSTDRGRVETYLMGKYGL